MKSGRKPYCSLPFAAIALMAAGCHQYLAGTPYLLQQQDPEQVYARCAPESRTPDASVLYATDRSVVSRNEGETIYGHARSANLVFGIAKVKLNPHPSWQELIEESTTAKRQKEYEMKLAEVHEEGRLTGTAEPGVSPGTTVVQAAVHAGQQSEAANPQHFQDLLRTRLTQTNQKDVYVFVHGFNNTFENAVFRAAEVWHFMGRTGVPLVYSWPAGLGGLRGYAYDRESGEFTVSHLRRFLQTVAACPDVERIHLIAHSRGTDVVISALRELNLVYRAQGKSTQRELKLENLVLAAPDIDEDVFNQRFVAERLFQAAHRTTIYASNNDRAIEAADWIFASRQRLGSLGLQDVTPKIRKSLAKLPNVQFIECKISSFWTINHDYIFSHPAALSDLILVLRDRRPPGAENGRPLNQPAEGLWELTGDYLAKK